MKLAIILLMLSLVAGQLVRLPLPGQGGGLLLSDVAVVLVLLAALHQFIKHSSQSTKPRQSTVPKAQNPNLCFVFCVLCFFILWSLFTLVLRFSDLGSHNFSIAALYWLRLTSNLLLLPALLILLRRRSLHRFTQRAFLIIVIVLIGLGFFQFFFFPNLNMPGFDPHRGRLVSTWLDPNLFGGFLVIAVPWLITTRYSLLTLPALAALILTQSRSSFAALAAVALLFSSFLVRFRLNALMSLLILLAAVTVFFPQRVLGLLTADETASLRLTSLASAWQLAEAHPWLGVGYNAYQFAAADFAQNNNFTIHSRAGADNSLLTLWVTTGLAGVLLFFLPWIIIARHLPLASNASLLALFIHSQFVNSFLYSHVLITLIIIIALTWPRSTENS